MARQTTEILTNNLTQDITITYNDTLQKVRLIRIDRSLTRDKHQSFSKLCINVLIFVLSLLTE